MTEIRLITISLLSFLLLIGSLWLVNYREEERYKQLWAPFLAIVFTLVVLKFNFIFDNFIVEFLVERFPILESYLLLFFNAFILIVFLALKTFLKVSAIGLRWIRTMFKGGSHRKNVLIVLLLKFLPESYRQKAITRKSKDVTVAVAYEKGLRDVTLKPEWFYPRKLFLFASLIPFAIIFFYIVSIYVTKLDGVKMFLPTYPALSLILLLEAAWFLGGRKPQYRTGNIYGKDAEGRTKAKYEKLYEHYLNLWPERILTKGQLTSPSAVQIGMSFNYGDNITTDVQRQYIEICERLKRESIPLVQSHTEFLLHMLEEKDVLVEDPVYDDIRHFLFPAIYATLVKNKKIIVVAKDKAAAVATVDWLKLGLKQSSRLEFLWKITTLEKAFDDNVDTNILVITPENLVEKSLYDYVKNLNSTANFEMVLFFEAERVFAEYGMFIHTFVLRLEDLLERKPQYVVMSQWFEGLETAVRKITKANIYDTLVKIPRSENFFYIIWKKEGKGRFQETILPRLTHRFIEAEAVLATVALKFDIHAIRFLYQDKNPVSESVEELIDNREHLLDYNISSYLIDTFRERSFFHQYYWQVPVEKHNFLLIRDLNYNVVDTLTQWWSNGKTDLFIQIVSPPYLLRDYLATTIDFYLNNNRMISPLAPRLSQTSWGTAYFLIERMTQSFIAEEELNSILTHVGIEHPNVLDGLNLFFQKCFDPEEDYQHAIEIRKQRLFHPRRKEFYDVLTYKLSARIKNALIPNWGHFYEFKTQTGDTVSQLFKGHLYQNYLVGQLHAFNGNLYQIRRADERTGVVDVSFESLTEKRIYRQDRTYLIEEPENVVGNGKEYGPISLKMNLSETKFSVITDGYFSFDDGLHLNHINKQNYYPLSEKEHQHVKRTYRNGKVLKVTFKGNQLLLAERDKVAFTLAFLLNETLCTFFPNAYMYVAATTFVDEKFFATTDVVSTGLKRMFPTLECNQCNDVEDEISIYILEDSPLQLGLVESVQANWMHILNIIDDYVKWLLADINKNGEFLAFGEETIATQFDFQGVSELIAHLLPARSLNETRQAFLTKRPTEVIDADIETRQCDFCAREYYETEFEHVDDERDRCSACKKSAVDRVGELISLYQQIRHYFIENFGIELRREIDVHLLNAKELHDTSGLPFIPKTEFNPRIVGKASIDKQRNINVYIENGSPRLQTLMTLAHELAHVWQFDNLNVHYMTLEELEGFASWVEVHFAKTIGEPQYAKKLDNELMERPDAYGKGYREVVQILEERALRSPFELYHGESVTAE